MNFQNLSCFLMVVREMNYARAAEKLYLSQQALNGHIRRLEAECGTPLFERSPKLRLTYAGACVAKHAEQILDLEKQMEIQLSDIINLRSGRLSIGTSYARGRIFLPEVLPIYAQRYPTIELSLKTGISRDLEKLLLDGDLDLLIGFPPFVSDQIETVHVMRERLCLVVPDRLMEAQFSNPRTVSNHFATQGADIAAFQNCPFLMMCQGNRVRDIADQFLNANHIQLRVLLESADIETLLRLCSCGMGITFSFESFAQKTLAGSAKAGEKIHIFPLLFPDLTKEIVIAFHKNRYQSKAAKDFIALTTEIFAERSAI